MTEQEPAPKIVELTTCYRLGAIPYVPHFSAYGVYVAPGYHCTRLANLKQAGATAYKEYLWPRPGEFSAPWKERHEA